MSQVFFTGTDMSAALAPFPSIHRPSACARWLSAHAESSEAYETFLKAFPFSGKQWSQYAMLALNKGDFAKVEEVIGKTLTTLGSKHMWKFYVNFVVAKSDKQENAREIVQQAFEFALENLDFLSARKIYGATTSRFSKARKLRASTSGGKS